MDLLAQGINHESSGNMAAAEIAYKKLLETDPKNTSAHVNLGTIYYNRHQLNQAEKHYRSALYSDPNYALAYFDLGNVLDETNRREEAIEAYQAAIRLNPTYADAHYNLALAYQRCCMSADALRHWRAYKAMDQSGPWHDEAVKQIAVLAPAASLQIAVSNPKPRLTKRRAKLILVKR
jgi:tetratricopeptide (TPR) repeat protein